MLEMESKVEMTLHRAHVWWPILTCTTKTICCTFNSKLKPTTEEAVDHGELVIYNQVPGLDEVHAMSAQYNFSLTTKVKSMS